MTGNHIMIKQFSKVFLKRPDLPHYNCTRDVGVVFKHISDNLSKSTCLNVVSIDDRATFANPELY